MIHPVLEQTRDKHHLYVFFKQIPPLLIRLECAWVKSFLFSGMKPRHWPIWARRFETAWRSQHQERKSLQRLKMRPHCLEMPGINHPVRRRHILEERKPQLHRCGNLKKLRMLVWFEGNIWYSGLWPVGFPTLYLCDFYYIKVFDTVI
jgi:hypothetical protein